jgi:serum/glucocorticoid-regulated kinase 2
MDLISTQTSALVCLPSASSQVRAPFLCKICHTKRYLAGRGLSLAPGAQVPEVIQKALDSTPSRRSTNNRESMQRKRYWWLPYVVLEFDKNEILIDAMGGDLANPIWNYRADL